VQGAAAQLTEAQDIARLERPRRIAERAAAASIPEHE
jgi:hypothetical protein